MDKFRIDSHKLIYHPERVGKWLSGKPIYPIYMEISPFGGCNHRCSFCALDFMKYKAKSLDSDVLKKRLTEMGKLGIKSVMYAGEGEPLLYKDIVSTIVHTKKSGIDVSLTTNGVFLKPSISDGILKHTSWIKTSINAGKEDTYIAIHKAKAGDFEKVISNLTHANKLRKQKGYKCTLGVQAVLLPENQDEMFVLAEISKKIGMDYLVIKPYSQHPQSKTHKYEKIKYSNYAKLEQSLARLNSPGFNAIFRSCAMKKWDEADRNYQHCYALPFWAYMEASGDIYGCSMFLGDKRFNYGNIYTDSFETIWKNNEVSHIIFDATNCRISCRMDEINRYLWELKHPGEHVNFI